MKNKWFFIVTLVTVLIIVQCNIVKADSLEASQVYNQSNSQRVTEDDIQQLVKDYLCSLGIYSVQSCDSIYISTRYIVTQDYWLVNVIENSFIKWKSLVTSRGEILHLVPYKTLEPMPESEADNFWDETFCQNAFYEKSLFSSLLTYSMPHDERIVHAGRWKPLLDKWYTENPDYLDNPDNWSDYELIVLETFGVPSDGGISEEEAICIAKEEAIRLGASSDTIDSRMVGTYYLTTDVERPVWKITLGNARTTTVTEKEIFYPDDMHYCSCCVLVDANNGEVLEAYCIR